ncbi:uncharacterized protein B0I36DRAFT_333383 [Microdochium trichocladiopsis]|uniref:Uncharacterized protein n=1 Tax=Microdochium trichocladiopsis TaxID=1682393 RepID=A0A9P8XVG1_9PEZI|nr:uncharacterized protein B0I36DRAFT_333383 [Microdochium trichocladiopsis]KAH7020900.1 hypothetical protein B0I36DRAFT_333383 [Microdochium trichocladiopsis]
MEARNPLTEDDFEEFDLFDDEQQSHVKRPEPVQRPTYPSTWNEVDEALKDANPKTFAEEKIYIENFGLQHDFGLNARWNSPAADARGPTLNKARSLVLDTGRPIPVPERLERRRADLEKNRPSAPSEQDQMAADQRRLMHQHILPFSKSPEHAEWAKTLSVIADLDPSGAYMDIKWAKENCGELGNQSASQLKKATADYVAWLKLYTGFLSKTLRLRTMLREATTPPLAAVDEAATFTLPRLLNTKLFSIRPLVQGLAIPDVPNIFRDLDFEDLLSPAAGHTEQSVITGLKLTKFDNTVLHISIEQLLLGDFQPYLIFLAQEKRKADVELEAESKRQKLDLPRIDDYNLAKDYVRNNSQSRALPRFGIDMIPRFVRVPGHLFKLPEDQSAQERLPLSVLRRQFTEYQWILALNMGQYTILELVNKGLLNPDNIRYLVDAEGVPLTAPFVGQQVQPPPARQPGADPVSDIVMKRPIDFGDIILPVERVYDVIRLHRELFDLTDAKEHEQYARDAGWVNPRTPEGASQLKALGWAQVPTADSYRSTTIYTLTLANIRTRTLQFAARNHRNFVSRIQAEDSFARAIDGILKSTPAMEPLSTLFTRPLLRDASQPSSELSASPASPVELFLRAEAFLKDLCTLYGGVNRWVEYMLQLSQRGSASVAPRPVDEDLSHFFAQVFGWDALKKLPSETQAVLRSRLKDATFSSMPDILIAYLRNIHKTFFSLSVIVERFGKYYLPASARPWAASSEARRDICNDWRRFLLDRAMKRPIGIVAEKIRAEPHNRSGDVDVTGNFTSRHLAPYWATEVALAAHEELSYGGETWIQLEVDLGWQKLDGEDGCEVKENGYAYY